jgi:PTS system nitrogen regulatory IIA component
MAGEYKDTDHFYSDFSLFLKNNKIIKDSEKVKRLFIKRENIQTTATGKGAAAPHIFSDEFSEFILSISLIKKGLDFKAPDGENVYLVFLIMSDDREVGLHLKSLAHIARLINGTDIVEEAKTASTQEEIYQLFIEKDKMI